MREDYYQLLDAEPTASMQELRTAYRKAAKRYHPDLNNGDPAAEERFKLIAEAWRTLGDAEARKDYDDWLARRKRYASMPEMTGMPRRTRVSSRAVYERMKAGNKKAAERNRRPYRARPFLLRPRGSKVSGMAYVLVSLCFVVSMLPYLRHHLAPQEPPPPTAAEKHPELGYGESPLSPEEQTRNLENYKRRLEDLAVSGDASAQYRYGYLLYVGTGGVVQDKEAALRWWKLSAENGFPSAIKQLALIRTAAQKSSAPAVPEPAPGASPSTEPPSR